MTMSVEITRPNSMAMAPRSSRRKRRIAEITFIVRAPLAGTRGGGVPRLIPQDDRRLQVHLAVLSEDRRHEGRDHLPVVLDRVLHDLRRSADATHAAAVIPDAVVVSIVQAVRDPAVVDPGIVLVRVTALLVVLLALAGVVEAREDDEAHGRVLHVEEVQRVLVDDRQDLLLAVGRIRD